MDGRRPASSQAQSRKRGGHRRGDDEDEEEEDYEAMQGGGGRRRRALWREDDSKEEVAPAPLDIDELEIHDQLEETIEQPQRRFQQLGPSYSQGEGQGQPRPQQQQRQPQQQPEQPPPFQLIAPRLQQVVVIPPALPRLQQPTGPIDLRQVRGMPAPRRGAAAPYEVPPWAAGRLGLMGGDGEPGGGAGPYAHRRLAAFAHRRDRMAGMMGAGGLADMVDDMERARVLAETFDEQQRRDRARRLQFLREAPANGGGASAGGSAAAAAASAAMDMVVSVDSDSDGGAAAQPEMDPGVDLEHSVPTDPVSGVMENSDLLKCVLRELHVVELCRVACVSRLWRRAVNDPTFWRCVNLLGRPVTAEQVARLCRKQRGVIEDLRLGGSLVMSSDTGLLQRLIPNLTGLTSLELRFWMLSDRVVAQLSSGLPCLRVLQLREVQIVAQTPSAQSDASLAHPTLISLDMANCKAGRLALSCPQLTHLSLSASQLFGLAVSAASLPRLQSLHVASTQRLTDNGILTSLTSLRQLSLHDVPVAEEALRGAARSMKHLTALELSDCAGLGLSATRGGLAFAQLRRLVVRRCGSLTSAGAGLLIDGCASLEELVLEECGQLLGLTVALPLLRSVSLRRCRQLATLELRCRRLEELILGSQEPSAPGDAVLRRVTVASDSLRSIAWRRLSSLEEITLNCPSLTSLSLTDCDSLTDKIFNMLTDVQEVTLAPVRSARRQAGAAAGQLPQQPQQQQQPPARRGVFGLQAPLGGVFLPWREVHEGPPEGLDAGEELLLLPPFLQQHHPQQQQQQRAPQPVPLVQARLQDPAGGDASMLRHAILGGGNTRQASQSGGRNQAVAVPHLRADVAEIDMYARDEDEDLNLDWAQDLADHLFGWIPSGNGGSAAAAAPAGDGPAPAAPDGGSGGEGSGGERRDGGGGGGDDGGGDDGAGPSGSWGALTRAFVRWDSFGLGPAGGSAPHPQPQRQPLRQPQGQPPPPQQLPPPQSHAQAGPSRPEPYGKTSLMVPARFQMPSGGLRCSADTGVAAEQQQQQPRQQAHLRSGSRDLLERPSPQPLPLSPRPTAPPPTQQPAAPVPPQAPVPMLPPAHRLSQPVLGALPQPPLQPELGPEPGPPAQPQLQLQLQPHRAPQAQTQLAAPHPQPHQPQPQPAAEPQAAAQPQVLAHPKVGGCPRLQELRLEGCEGLRHARLRHARLARFSLRNCRGLLSVRLSCPALGSVQLEECGELESVALSTAGLGSLSLGACCALRDAELTCPSLEQLSLKGCGNLHHLYMDCPRLRELDATFCGGLTDQALASALRGRPPLASLLLSVCCSLGPSVPAALAGLEDLRHLDLSYSCVTRLGPVLSSCTRLTALCLGSCPELESGGEELLGLLPERGHALPHLASLDVSYCPLAAHVVVPLVVGLTRLTHLALNGCPGADEAIWRSVVVDPTPLNPTPTSSSSSSTPSLLEKLSLVRCGALTSLCLGLVPQRDDRAAAAAADAAAAAAAAAADQAAAGPHGAGRGWQWPAGGPAPRSLLGPPWRPVGCLLAGLRSLRLGLSGVQTVSVSLPHLTSLDLNGCGALRCLEIRCPALTELHLQACCALPDDLWGPLLESLGGTHGAGRGLTLLDAQHSGRFGEAVAATLAAAAIMAGAAEGDVDLGPGCSATAGAGCAGGTSGGILDLVATVGPAAGLPGQGAAGSSAGAEVAMADPSGAGGSSGAGQAASAGQAGGGGSGVAVVDARETALLAARDQPWWMLPAGATVLACGPDCNVCGRRNRRALQGLAC